MRWTHTTGDSVRTSPAISPSGPVFFGTGDKYLQAVRGDTGALLWRRALLGIPESPSLDAAGQRVYVGTDAGDVYCVDAGNGTVLWRFRTPTNNAIGSTPALNPVTGMDYDVLAPVASVAVSGFLGVATAQLTFTAALMCGGCAWCRF